MGASAMVNRKQVINVMEGIKIFTNKESLSSSSSLTHDQQEASSIDSEVVVHRFRIFGEVSENREPWCHVSLCCGVLPHGASVNVPRTEAMGKRKFHDSDYVTQKVSLHTRTISTAPTMYLREARQSYTD